MDFILWVELDRSYFKFPDLVHETPEIENGKQISIALIDTHKDQK